MNRVHHWKSNEQRASSGIKKLSKSVIFQVILQLRYSQLCVIIPPPLLTISGSSVIKQQILI